MAGQKQQEADKAAATLRQQLGSSQREARDAVTKLVRTPFTAAMLAPMHSSCAAAVPLEAGHTWSLISGAYIGTLIPAAPACAAGGHEDGSAGAA